MAKASKVIELAKSWIGKNEADGSFKEIIDIYNSQKPLPRGYKVKYTDAWCATFISALGVKLKCTDIILTECSCQKMIQKFKDAGCWQENENITPKVGYIIFYDWQDDGKGDATGWADHVGIVESVSNGKITIIEGNYNTKVARRTLEVNARYIRGYAMPKYEAEETVEAKVEAKPSTIVSASAYYSKYTGTSYKIDEVFKAIGVPSEYIGNKTKRNPIAVANGYNDYSGTYEQNSGLINLAKQGKLKVAGSVAETQYYNKYKGTSYKIDEVFKIIGVESKYIGSWSKRKPIAVANGIGNDYTGTAIQNGQLIALAKAGKLKRV